MLKFYVKVFNVMGKALSGAILCVDRSCCISPQSIVTLIYLSRLDSSIQGSQNMVL